MKFPIRHDHGPTLSAVHRPISRRSSHAARSDDGITLVEVLVSFLVLMIVIIPLTYLLTSEVQQAASSKNQVAALGLAEKWVEYLSTAEDPPPALGSLAVDTDKPLIPKLPNGTPVPSTTIGGTTFLIRSEYKWSGTQTPGAPVPDLCTSGGAQVLDLTVTVSWNSANQQVTDTTILNFPAPGIPQYGFYRLQVSPQTMNDLGGNLWSDRVQAIPVTITPFTAGPVLGTPVTVYPDQYGCVFAELSPGTYTVGVADPVSGLPAPGDAYGSPSFVQNYATDGVTTEPTAVNLATTASPVHDHGRGDQCTGQRRLRRGHDHRTQLPLGDGHR